ncbi:MAG: aminotransferase class I/II-fold pyridoxal phosphate-dependent enzyme [Clostridia bacterium]|nr:aminotransferase class I/II-fold pyridoxal phosphate-dependent enzyme [Clostridia bacterium]
MSSHRDRIRQSLKRHSRGGRFRGHNRRSSRGRFDSRANTRRPAPDCLVWHYFGILTGIRAATNTGDKILVARNCHKSVYNAIEVNFLNPIYLVPSIDVATGINNSITPKQVEESFLENLDTKLVVITSPTYEGVMSDIKGIVEIAHKYGVPVLVDEAHGAHLYYTKNSAVSYGADIVINSVHKTLPSLTQTAIAHINGNLISCEKFTQALKVFETTSPSYILMSSIDACVRLLTQKGDKLFNTLYKNLTCLNDYLKNLKNLTVVCYGQDNLKMHSGFYNFDSPKIVISTVGTSINGMQLFNKLRDKFKIELEMAYTNYALAMVTIFDNKKTLKKLADAIISIDKEISKNLDNIITSNSFSLPLKAKNASEVRNQKGKLIKLKESLGCISLEYLWAYPPGIPLLVPGEVIDEQLLKNITYLLNNQVVIHSTFNNAPENIMAIL